MKIVRLICAALALMLTLTCAAEVEISGGTDGPTSGSDAGTPAASIAIIGGADGPTAIFLAGSGDEDAAAAETGATPAPEAAGDAPTVTDVQIDLPLEVTATPMPEPTGRPRLMGIRIGIDPGHQEHANSDRERVSPDSNETKAKVSSGTSGRSTGIPEYVTNLEISLKLRQALEELGCEVYMTRETNDVDISNLERAELMNGLGVDLVLRIHCDGAEDRSANGIGMFVRKTGEKQAESEAAAEVLLDAMVEATGAKRRGVYLRDTYTMNNWSVVPCILVECGFLSNPGEDEKLNDPDYQDLLVKGMVEGICRCFPAAEGTECLTAIWASEGFRD